MAEAVAADGARILADGLRLVVGLGELAVVVRMAVEIAVLVVGLVERLVEAVRLFELPLVRRDERGEHAGQSVDLMAAQLRAGREAAAACP